VEVGANEKEQSSRRPSANHAKQTPTLISPETEYHEEILKSRLLPLTANP